MRVREKQKGRMNKKRERKREKRMRKRDRLQHSLPTINYRYLGNVMQILIPARRAKLIVVLDKRIRIQFDVIVKLRMQLASGRIYKYGSAVVWKSRRCLMDEQRCPIIK